MNEDNKRSFLERLQDSYRLVIFDEEDLKEVTSFSFSLLILYIFISSVFVLLTAIVVSFIVFTPIKTWIPGYGDIKQNTVFVELNQKIDDLEKDIEAHNIYTHGLQNMLKSIENTEQNGIIPSGTQMIKNEDIVETNKAKELDQLVFAKPVSGTISAEYDATNEHMGTDIIAPKGTAIKSIMEGVVLNAEWSAESGNTVYIQHPKNIISVYKHNSAVLVKSGQKVSTGEAIAIIGNSGEASSGPHLHFELWYDGIPVNPKNYIAFQ